MNLCGQKCFYGNPTFSILFNLMKKPDADQRKVILRGFKKIARYLGHDKVEAELLPQLWEQIDHKVFRVFMGYISFLGHAQKHLYSDGRLVTFENLIKKLCFLRFLDVNICFSCGEFFIAFNETRVICER